MFMSGRRHSDSLGLDFESHNILFTFHMFQVRTRIKKSNQYRPDMIVLCIETIKRKKLRKCTYSIKAWHRFYTKYLRCRLFLDTARPKIDLT